MDCAETLEEAKTLVALEMKVFSFYFVRFFYFHFNIFYHTSSYVTIRHHMSSYVIIFYHVLSYVIIFYVFCFLLSCSFLTLVQMRLLDLEGFEIPKDPPAIPEIPTDFDFVETREKRTRGANANHHT